MTRLIWRAALALLWLAPAGIRVSPAGASSVRKLALSELYCEADLVAYAVVERQSVEGDFQLSTLRVLGAIKGSAESGEVVERSSSGLHGDHPAYATQQAVVAFLATIPGSDQYRTVGLAQGKYEIVGGRVTRADLGLEEFLSVLERIDCDPANQPS